MKEDEVTVLIKYRLEQAQEALADAKFLFDGNRSTLSIINRSYYAVFYAALALLQKTGKVPRKHSGVISLFDYEFVKQDIFPKELSKIVHRLFTARQVSDYHVMEPLGMEEAEGAIRDAEIFVNAVRTFLFKNGADSYQ